MAADAGIFQQYMQPVRSVADYAGDMDKQEQNALTLAALRMKGQQDQQTMQDSQAFRQLAQGYGGDMNALSQAAMKAGLIPQAQALQKSMLESDKLRADVRKTQADALDKQLGAFRSFVPQINSPEAAGQYAAAMYDHPELGKLAAQFGSRDDVIKRNMEAFAKDPRSWMVNSAGVTADKLLSSLEGKRQNINAGGTSIGQTINYYGEVVPGKTTVTPITQSADNAASNATTQRGQNMTDSRARAGQAQSAAQFAAGQSTPEYKQDGEGNWIALPKRITPGASITAQPVFGVDGKPLSGNSKALTDGQAKAALFGSRMQSAHQTLAALESKGTTTTLVPGMDTGFGIGSLANMAASGNQQQLMQAKRDFINATLRRESGAVISPSEFSNGEKQYFPQIGDTKETMAQKANNRAIAIRGVQAEIPRQQRGVVNEITGKNAQGWELHTDAKGNKAYVSPDGKQFEEVR